MEQANSRSQDGVILEILERISSRYQSNERTRSDCLQIAYLIGYSSGYREGSKTKRGKDER